MLSELGGAKRSGAGGQRSSSGLEKDVMIGFYVIRKLIEAHTVSDEIANRDLSLQGHAWIGSAVTFMNWDKIDKHYDLGHSIPVTNKVRWLADQIIHSFVFMPCFDENGRLHSIFFNSDRSRLKYLYKLPVDDITALFEQVGANDPSSMECRFNKGKGDYDVKMGPTMELDIGGASISSAESQVCSK
jgi:hypothetical protein